MQIADTGSRGIFVFARMHVREYYCLLPGTSTPDRVRWPLGNNTLLYLVHFTSKVVVVSKQMVLFPIQLCGGQY